MIVPRFVIFRSIVSKCVHCDEPIDRTDGFCASCIEKSKKVWWPRDKEIRARYSRKSKYGLSPAEYLKLMEEQKGACAICKKKPGKAERSLCVDHDHRTDAIRGLLCHSCNFMIGHSGDSVHNLMGGARYLHAHVCRIADEAEAAKKAKRRAKTAT